MNIGILTFQNAINFGAICQMRALYEMLNKKNEIQIINYFDTIIEKRYSLFDISNTKAFIRSMLTFRNNYKQKKKFYKFRNEMNMSESLAKDKLKNLKYDLVISGSDQIWNLDLTNNDFTYFLDWFGGEKASYAASFGVDELGKEYDKCLHLLNKYKGVSIREKNNLQQLSLYVKNCEYHIDPIFLLNKNQWLEYMKLPVIEDYILIYTIGITDSILEFARKLAEKNNLKIYYITNNIKPLKDINKLSGIGPKEWLGYIYNAKYVITNSFHGMAFSINFNKSFYYDNVKTNLKNTNNRILNLLDIFQIKKRSIYENDFEEINYLNVNKIIEKERKRSIDYLNRIIEN